MLDNLNVDFSRKAVFMPGSIAPFEVWRDEWLTDFSEDNLELISWWAANLCHIAYCSPAGIAKILQGRGELLRVFQHRNEMAFAVRVKDIIFLVFQGSAGGEDVVLDISFLPTKDGEYYVHRGFKKALNYLWSDIAGFLDEYSSSKFYYCGHSLGGAMAQLSALRVAPAGIVTFGSPRVAFAGFQRAFKVPHWRFVNGSDLVTFFLPVSFGFRHTGELVFINRNQTLLKKPSFVQRFGSQLRGSLQYALSCRWLNWRNNLTRSLTDHAPVNYCRALSRHLLIDELEKK